MATGTLAVWTINPLVETRVSYFWFSNDEFDFGNSYSNKTGRKWNKDLKHYCDIYLMRDENFIGTFFVILL